jgi:hypothetical protein
MEEALYLIKHRLRNEVVIDVAQRWLLGCGKSLWLVLTSGQRAYPFEFTPLVQRAGEMMVRADPATLGIGPRNSVH